MSPDGTPSFWVTAPDGTKLQLAKHGEGWVVIYPNWQSAPQPPPDGAGDELREAVRVLFDRYRGVSGGMLLNGGNLSRSQESAVKEFLALSRPASPAAEQDTQARARQQDTQAAEQGKWRPIESAPRDGTTVIVGCFVGARLYWARDAKHHPITGWYSIQGDQNCQAATHWFPSPPQAEKE